MVKKHSPVFWLGIVAWGTMLLGIRVLSAGSTDLGFVLGMAGGLGVLIWLPSVVVWWIKKI